MPDCGFAVLNFETSGLFDTEGERVVEVAVVHLSSAGDITGSWHSVVNPGLNPGDWLRHGISSEQIRSAPTFPQIAPRLWELLSGRALVAHNAEFTTGFLMAEFARMGYRPRRGMEAICTMQLARDLLPGAGRSLVDCCAAFDIGVGDAHRSLGKATATAHLLSSYLQCVPDQESWADALDRAAASPWAPLLGERATWMPRAVQPTGAVPATGFLERLSLKLSDYTGPDECLDYLAMLDLCLLNRQFSDRDRNALMQMAEARGIDRSTCAELNTGYCDELARVAWGAGTLSAVDQADLLLVTRMLGVPDSHVTSSPHLVSPARRAVPQPKQHDFTLQHGDIVVLTGELARSRTDWNRELGARGFRVAAAVTMRTRLLVASDPAASTGKSGKARDYGIPIVSEFGLRALIGVH